MKNLFLISLILFSLPFAKAQTAQKDLDINNVRATITNMGYIFNNGSNARYEVPKQQIGQVSKTTIWSAAPWMGGLSNGQLYLAAETYRQSGRDFRQGPTSSDTSLAFLTYWDRLWKINKIDLDTFRARVNTGSDVSTGFEDILNWPARGNVYGGDTITEYAPFVDVNSNHLYEPLLGDYPQIKGDQCIYTIINDNIPHTESFGEPLKVDIHRMVYAFATNNAVNNTVFVDYKVVNKSNRDYELFAFSSWVDFDLGKYDDDYVGTDTLRNMIYGYNGDATDESSAGYGTTPPAQACVFLNQQMLSSMYYNNTNDSITGNVFVANDYYNYMIGRWKDGTPKTAAGIGHNTSGALTNFSFSGDPCNNTGWWEGSSTIMPGDRRMLASISPQTFLQNQELNVSLAFVYARATSGNNISSVCALQGAVDSVVNWYKNPAKTGIQKTEKPFAFSIFPNPAKTAFTIQGIETQNATVSIFDITGKQVKSESLVDGNSMAIADLKTGLYLVKISTENGSATKRLVVE